VSAQREDRPGEAVRRVANLPPRRGALQRRLVQAHSQACDRLAVDLNRLGTLLAVAAL
jgi:hypothetical protein